MARLAVGMVFGVVVGVLVGAAAGLRADDDDIVVAASELGLDEQDLRGAVNTSGYDPRTYLCLVKEGPCPKPAIVTGVWDRLAGCESSGNWASISNPKYKGGLQMDAAFWSTHGGLRYAAAPQLATREQQIQVAINGRDGLVGQAQGWAAWPACSRRLGLR